MDSFEEEGQSDHIPAHLSPHSCALLVLDIIQIQRNDTNHSSLCFVEHIDSHSYVRLLRFGRIRAIGSALPLVEAIHYSLPDLAICHLWHLWCDSVRQTNRLSNGLVLLCCRTESTIFLYVL